MCGREQSGFQAAASTLYDGKLFLLCRNRNTTRRSEKLAISIVNAVKAQPIFITATTHDEIVALTSHLPYLLSAMLASQVGQEANHDGRYWRISATGLRDATRPGRIKSKNDVGYPEQQQRIDFESA